MTDRQMTFAEQPPSVYGETSEAAAEAIKPTAARLRTRVYERLVLAGWDGMTDEELQVALRMAASTQRPSAGGASENGFGYRFGPQAPDRERQAGDRMGGPLTRLQFLVGVCLGFALAVVLLLVGGITWQPPPPPCPHCLMLTHPVPGCQAVVGGWVC